MQRKVPELYQMNSFSHWPGSNNPEFFPQSFNSSSTSLTLIQSLLFWLKQVLSGKVQQRPATSWQQPAIDIDSFNFGSNKISSQSKDMLESENTALLVYHYKLLCK